MYVHVRNFTLFRFYGYKICVPLWRLRSRKSKNKDVGCGCKFKSATDRVAWCDGGGWGGCLAPKKCGPAQLRRCKFIQG